jgi:hypothetical protein
MHGFLATCLPVSIKYLGGVREGRSAVKMIAEYLEHALQFERLAAEEPNPELRAQLEKQAAAYRKLATERTKKLGLESPPDSAA